jgi:hypothetical protein
MGRMDLKVGLPTFFISIVWMGSGKKNFRDNEEMKGR